MDSSTEQLVRDYLNRLAVAARQSLSPGELMSFIARMRSAIERQVGPHGAATPAEVATMLAALGAPKGLVELEQQRLAAAQTDRGRAAGSARAIEPPIMLPTARNATTATDPRIPALPPGTGSPSPGAARPAASKPAASSPAASNPAAVVRPPVVPMPLSLDAAKPAPARSAGSPDGSLAFIAEPVNGPQGSVSLARFTQDLPPTPPPAWPPLARSPDAQARPEAGRRLRLRSHTTPALPARPGRGTGRAAQDQPAGEPGDPAGREPARRPWAPGTRPPTATNRSESPQMLPVTIRRPGQPGAWRTQPTRHRAAAAWGPRGATNRAAGDEPVRSPRGSVGQDPGDEPVWDPQVAAGQDLGGERAWRNTPAGTWATSQPAMPGMSGWAPHQESRMGRTAGRWARGRRAWPLLSHPDRTPSTPRARGHTGPGHGIPA